MALFDPKSPFFSFGAESVGGVLNAVKKVASAPFDIDGELWQVDEFGQTVPYTPPSVLPAGPYEAPREAVGPPRTLDAPQLQPSPTQGMPDPFVQQYGVPESYIPDLMAEGAFDPSLGGQDEWQRYGGLTPQERQRYDAAMITRGLRDLPDWAQGVEPGPTIGEKVLGGLFNALGRVRDMPLDPAGVFPAGEGSIFTDPATGQPKTWANPREQAMAAARENVPGVGGEVLANIANIAIDPTTLMGAAAAGKGMIPNIAGRGSLTVPQYGASIAGAGAGAYGGGEAAEAVGLPRGLGELGGGLLGGVGGVFAPGAAKAAIRAGMPETPFGAANYGAGVPPPDDLAGQAGRAVDEGVERATYTTANKNYATRMIKRAEAEMADIKAAIANGSAPETSQQLARAERELAYAKSVRERMQAGDPNAWDSITPAPAPPASSVPGAALPASDVPAGAGRNNVSVSGGARLLSEQGGLIPSGVGSVDPPTLRRNKEALRRADPELAKAVDAYVLSKAEARFARESAQLGDSTNPLLRAIDEAEPTAPRLIRGMSGTRRGLEQFLTPGNTVDIPLGSFATNGQYARTFIKARDTVRIQLELEEGAKALDLRPVSKFQEGEWLTSGRFEVVEVIPARFRVGGSVLQPGPSAEVLRVRVRQLPSSRMGAATAPPPRGAPTTTAGAGAPPPAQPPAPPTGGGGPAGGDDFAGNIRLNKYPEEARDQIKQWATDHPDEVQAARRGIRSDEQVQADAQALIDELGDGGLLDKKAWQAGQAWNAEEIVAIRGTLNDATAKVRSAAQVAATAPGDMGKHLDLAAAIMEQQRIQQAVHGVTAEAGRALRAFRQQADAVLSSGDVRQAQELLQRSLGTSNPEDMTTLAKAIAVLDETKPAAANKLIRDINKPDFWDKIHYYWMNSILSGPVTHARNIAGNVGATLYMPVQRVGAAAIEQPLAAIQGRQAQRFWQEAPASVVGIFQGIPQGVQGALTTLRTGISPRAAAKLEIRPQPIKGVAGSIIGAPTRALGAMDEFFSAINYRASLNGNAQRMARSEGLKGEALANRIADLVNDPPPNLMTQSTKMAEELVFRGDPGETARALAYLRQKVPGGRYVIPFLNTPANLLKYGVKNSPLGLLDMRAWKKAIAGNPEGVDDLAHGVMGSMVAASLSGLVATGALDLTAAAPINSAERDRFYREGKRPFSVKLPGVGWVEYKQIPALDTTFTLVASAVDGIRRGEDVSGIVSQAGANIATNLLDKSYMSGLGDLFDAIQDPIRFAEQYATRQISGFVPASSALRQTAQAIDPTIRSPQGLAEQLQANIPGLTGNVPPRLTAFGEESKRGFPSPIQVSAAKQSKVDAELERLGMEVGFVGGKVGDETLSRETRSNYQRVAGQITYLLLDRTMSREAYAGLDDAVKQEVTEKMITAGRDFFRQPFATVIESDAYQNAPKELQQQLLIRLGERMVEKAKELQPAGAR